MRWLILSLLVAIGVPSTFAEPVIPPVTHVNNGCLIAALEAEAALTAKNDLSHVTWAKLVRVEYSWLKPGHAYCVYALLNGDIYSYDINHGSLPLGTRLRDKASIKAGLRSHDPLISKIEFLD